MEMEPGRGVRRWRLIGAAVVVIGVVSPVLRDRDSFPLSTYPVYASARPRTATFDTVIATRADGSSVHLSMAAIAGTDDPLIAQQRVRDAVSGDRADELCARVARRAPAAAAVIEVVTQVHDVVEAAEGRASLLRQTTHARCSAGTAGS
jgi:hypothetical protein